jgi:hypothetical protein
LFVFWLGTDVGVFTAAVFVKNPRYSFETRKTLLHLLSVVDIFPRVCFALILPVGLQLTKALGLYPVTPGLLAAGWIIGLGWTAAILVMMRAEGTALARTLNKLQLWFQGVMGVLFVSVGGLSLLRDAPLAPGWFAGKILLFGFIFWMGIALHVLFRPFDKPFAEIGTQGSTPEREAAVTGAINQALVGVLVLYALIAIIAFLGTVKPF